MVKLFLFFLKKKWVQVCHCNCGAVTKLKSEYTKCSGCGYYVSTLVNPIGKNHYAEIKYAKKRNDGTWEFRQ